MHRHCLIALIILLSSCSAFRRQPNDVALSEVNVSTSSAAALDTSFFVSGEWPKETWWTEFGDAQLNYVIDVALSDNPTLSSAYHRALSATSQARSVASKLFPKLGAHFQELYAHLSDESLFRIPPSTLQAVINQVDLGLFFDYELDFWGKNTEKYRAALGDACAKKAQEAGAKISLISTITRTYFRYAFLFERKKLLESVYAVSKEIVDLHTLRKAHGLDDQFNVNRAESSLLEIEKVISGIDASLATTIMQLKVLMGRSPDDQFVFQSPTIKDVSHFPIPNKLSIDLLVRRSDIAASLWNVRSKQHLIKSSKAAYFPSVNLAAYGGLEALSWGKLFSPSSLTGFLFPSLNLPLFQGFQLEANLNKAHEEYSVAVYEYNEKILHAANEVTSSLRMLRADMEERSYQAQHTEKKKEDVQLEELRFETGVSKRLDVLQRKIALLEDTLTLVDVEEQYFQELVNLVYALGGGYGNIE